MPLDENFLTDLKFKNSIEDVISEFVTLKRQGNRLTGLCPFHNEKTPSFTVFVDTQSYYCFGCGQGGDVITFIMKMNNLDYIDAVEYLAARAGMEMPTENQSENRIQKSRLIEMHRLAAKHFYENLINEKTPEALNYLKSRSLTMSVIKKYGLGYALDSFNDITGFLMKNGFRREEIYAAGLCSKSQKNSSYYDKFRNRVIFPIIDIRGNIVAFSGRILDDSMPKYLNSPDTPIYNKGQTVFSLCFAKDSGKENLILVEGNVDVVMLYQAGFKNAIAPLGTAFTKEQARLISKYTQNVVIAFDSDGAGVRATDKATKLLEQVGVNTKVLQIKGAKDPDEFIKKYGPERFEMLINGSKNPTEFKLLKLKQQYDLSDVNQKMLYSKEAIKIIASLNSEIEQQVFLTSLAKEIDVPVESVRFEVKRTKRQRDYNYKKQALNKEIDNISGSFDSVNKQRRSNLKSARAEEQLIALIAKNPDLYEYISNEISPDDFVTDFNKRVFKFYMDKLKENEVVDTVLLSNNFSGDELSKIIYILNCQTMSQNFKLQAKQCIETILSGKKPENIKELTAEQINNLIKNKFKEK